MRCEKSFYVSDCTYARGRNSLIRRQHLNSIRCRHGVSAYYIESLQAWINMKRKYHIFFLKQDNDKRRMMSYRLTSGVFLEETCQLTPLLRENANDFRSGEI